MSDCAPSLRVFLTLLFPRFSTKAPERREIFWRTSCEIAYVKGVSIVSSTIPYRLMSMLQRLTWKSSSPFERWRHISLFPWQTRDFLRKIKREGCVSQKCAHCTSSIIETSRNHLEIASVNVAQERYGQPFPRRMKSSPKLIANARDCEIYWYE